MAQDDIAKIKADEQAIQDRKKTLIDALLKKREAQNKEIDDQLAELGYRVNGSRPKRSHHKKGQPSAEKPKA